MSVENSLKSGVDLRNLAPQWGLAYPIIQSIFNVRGYSCVVTNGNERTPEQMAKKPKTLHPSGKALDFRTKHVPVMDKAPIRDAIIKALGPQWDVILENIGQVSEHVHIEFDTKEPSSEPV